MPDECSQGFDAAYSFGAYEGALRKLIHLLKYDRIRTLAGRWADHLVSAFPRDQRFDAVVPMPLHWLRHWRRGFNQSALLAEGIGPALRASRWSGPSGAAAPRRRRRA